MRKHSFTIALALAMLLAIAGLTPMSAGTLKGDHSSSGQAYMMINGQFVPCPEGACSKGKCKLMTPEECAKLGCNPGQCATGASATSAAVIIPVSALHSQVAASCNGKPCTPCPSSQGCAKAASSSQKSDDKGI